MKAEHAQLPFDNSLNMLKSWHRIRATAMRAFHDCGATPHEDSLLFAACMGGNRREK
jgi:hypothetical protein